MGYPDDHPVNIARRKRGLTLRELAEAVSALNELHRVSVPALSNIERGYIPSAERRAQIAAVLNTPVDELWPPGSGV